jgi:hypothetical protein
MGFISIEAKISGLQYEGYAYTVQDLELDSSGVYIYAEGTVTVKRVLMGWYCNTRTLYLNNRGFKIIDGQRSYVKPFYVQSQAQECLDDLILRMHIMGRAN